MSSNPFRRSKLPETSAPSLALAVEAPSVVGRGAPSTPPTRTRKKRVKIQTPPHSPELTHASDNNERRRLSASDSAGRAESPPPPPGAFEETESESDSTATADSELEEAVKNTRRNSGSLPPQTNSTVGGMTAPFNPFARTLATRNAGYDPQPDATQDVEVNAGNGAGRPALDVESFKNILLTGSASPMPVAGAVIAPVSTTTLPRPHDSSSSTDTSSIFESGYGIHPESPRTSFDDYEDASSSEGEHDVERQNLMGEGRSDDLAPPAPPKPKTRGPQTVSFADFDQSIPPDFKTAGRGASANAPVAGILRPSMPRSVSDLNKPLPAPPMATPDPSPPAVPDKDLALSPQITPTGPVLPGPADVKKVTAPPPPPARRMVGDNGRPRSSSNQSNMTQDITNTTGASDLQLSESAVRSGDAPAKHAPPPPPARKSQAASHNSSETISHSPSPSQSINEVPKFIPAPPPRRNPSKSVKGENSARSSTDIPRLMKPGDAFLAAAAPSNAPPAPPPRRAGSKRSSLDEPRGAMNQRVGGIDAYRRGSGNSVDSQTSTSIGSLQRVPEPGETTEPIIPAPLAEPQRDILADMSAFQAEIDALRAKSGSGR